MTTQYVVDAQENIAFDKFHTLPDAWGTPSTGYGEPSTAGWPARTISG